MTDDKIKPIEPDYISPLRVLAEAVKVAISKESTIKQRKEAVQIIILLWASAPIILALLIVNRLTGSKND